MNKNLLLLFIFLLPVSFAKSQYVNIPDSAFRSFLKNKYPSCFDVNDKMDTTCSAITGEATLEISGKSGFAGTTTLDGLQYFKSLHELDVTDFPNVSSLPALSDSITFLNCMNDGITALPVLPDQLSYLLCSYNKLTALPALPGFLISLTCRNNLLTALPSLNDSLDDLDCSFNPISYLPKLPNGLGYLKCDSTLITCLPVLPYYIRQVIVDSSNIHCRPFVNKAGVIASITSAKFTLLNLPNCDSSGNTGNCTFHPFISGKVFFDNNSNGIKDTNEPYAGGRQMFLSENNVKYKTIVNDTGAYLLSTDNTGDFNIGFQNVPNYFQPSPSAVHFDNSSNSIVQDIALQPVGTHDSVTISGSGFFVSGGFIDPMFPGMQPAYYNGSITINYQNNGTTALVPIITVYYDSSKFKYTGSSDSSVINTGLSLVLTDSTLQPGESRTFTLSFADSNLKTFPDLGDPIITTANIISDDNRTGNTTTFVSQAVGLLPLKLVSFNGFVLPDQTTSLSWSTADEVNTRSFIIEESSDGKNFKSIGSIPANKRTINNYSYAVNGLSSALTYFRLKMIDDNGSYTYSNVIKISSAHNASSVIRLFPNPVNNTLNISINNNLLNTKATLINSNGITVKNILLERQSTTIDVSHLSQGLYYLKTQSNVNKIMIIH